VEALKENTFYAVAVLRTHAQVLEMHQEGKILPFITQEGVHMNLVVTATGVLGGMVARKLLTEGKPVRAFVRPSSSYAELKAAGAEIAIGDRRDVKSLQAACTGVDRVIVSATARIGNPTSHCGKDCAPLAQRCRVCPHLSMNCGQGLAAQETL
jgi:hypothetical protein